MRLMARRPGRIGLRCAALHCFGTALFPAYPIVVSESLQQQNAHCRLLLRDLWNTVVKSLH